HQSIATKLAHFFASYRRRLLRRIRPQITLGMNHRLLKTNMCKTSGWAPRGERLVDHAPFGHWSTQTFIATLRHDRLDAPWVLSGPMNRVRFETYVETQLAPTLNRGDVIILDNLSSHHSPK